MKQQMTDYLLSKSSDCCLLSASCTSEVRKVEQLDLRVNGCARPQQSSSHAFRDPSMASVACPADGDTCESATVPILEAPQRDLHAKVGCRPTLFQVNCYGSGSVA